MASFLCSDTSAAAVEEVKVLHSSTVDYSILDCLGEGGFGKVFKCKNLDNNETVAVKKIKKRFEHTVQDEISILKVISVLDADETHLLKFYQHFVFMDCHYLSFELLEINLVAFMQSREWEFLSVTDIRTIAEQLLVALDALKGLGVIHTDIKPDNIMLVSGTSPPLTVKLIDFGLAFQTSHMKPGLHIQAAGYRAPEVSIGLPFTEAIDMFSLGCVLAYLYIVDHIFPICKYQTMKRIVELVGLPKDHDLQAGLYTRSFFVEDADNSKWRLKTPEEYQAECNVKTVEEDYFVEFSSLDDLVFIYPVKECGEVEEREAFVDLLKQLLSFDGNERISPRQALLHPFFCPSLNHQTNGQHHPSSQEEKKKTCPAHDGKSTEAESLPPIILSFPEWEEDQSSEGVSGCFGSLKKSIQGQFQNISYSVSTGKFFSRVFCHNQK